MRKIKTRKSRGKKLNGKDSGSFCGCCMFWHCDGLNQSEIMSRKIHQRREQGVCFPCGQKPCVCKSKSHLKEPVWK